MYYWSPTAFPVPHSMLPCCFEYAAFRCYLVVFNHRLVKGSKALLQGCTSAIRVCSVARKAAVHQLYPTLRAVDAATAASGRQTALHG